MSQTVTYSGRSRYRVHKSWFGKQLVVLQVEVRHKGYSMDRFDDHYDVDYCVCGVMPSQKTLRSMSLTNLSWKELQHER